jgi:hypothetical protein
MQDWAIWESLELRIRELCDLEDRYHAQDFCLAPGIRTTEG